jgi:hypothetical protein
MPIKGSLIAASAVVHGPAFARETALIFVNAGVHIADHSLVKVSHSCSRPLLRYSDRTDTLIRRSSLAPAS